MAGAIPAVLFSRMISRRLAGDPREEGRQQKCAPTLTRTTGSICSSSSSTVLSRGSDLCRGEERIERLAQQFLVSAAVGDHRGVDRERQGHNWSH